MRGAALRMRLLGGFEVEGIDASSLGSRKGRTLLKRLALDAGVPVPADSLVAILWPDDAGPARPGEQVSVLVSRLRRALGAAAITFADGSYTLAVDWLDVDELRRRTEEAARRLEDGSAAQARAAAGAALALVRGPLLAEDLDEPWTQTARAAVDRVVSRARQVAAEGALAGGLAWEAAEYASAALSADPYDEAALRALMRAHVGAGRPALALAAYADTAALVAEELGVDLDQQSQDLHVEVLRGPGGPTVASVPIAEQLSGRQSELAALEAAYERAVRGTAVVVAVEGEAGIGKTRLLDAFAEWVRSSAEVLRANAQTVGVLPLEPILDLLARRLSTAADDERSALLGPEAELLEPLLWPAAAGDPTAYRDVLVAHEPGEQSAPAVLHVALLAVMSRLCARRPVVLLLDDAHRADAATAAWCGLVARHGAGMRMLVVTASRPGARLIAAGETITLDRLDPKAAAAVIAGFVDEDRLAAIVERSAGLPLFLVELAQATGEALPATILESVVARFAEAGAATATIRAAAVLGREIDLDLLGTVLDRPTRELLDHLEEGASRRILDDASTGYVFHHELIREALEADTSSARRAWLHRQAAHALVRRAPVDQLLVAHHARLGGDPALAAQALQVAAAQAGARFDHEAALALADESLSLAETAAAHLVRGNSFVLLRRYDEARQAAERARALGAGAEALEVAAFAAYYSRDLESVLRLADEAAATSDNPEVLDSCQFLAAKVLHTRGELTEADRRLASMAAAPMRSQIAPFARMVRCLVHLHRGDLAATRRDLAGSDSARVAPVPYAPLYVDQFIAHFAGLDGRPLDAIAAAERMQRAVAEQGAVRFAGRAEVYQAWARSILCDPSALDAIEAACEVARSAGNPEPLGQGGLDLAAAHLDGGRIEAAVAALDDVDRLLATSGQISNGWRIELRARYLRGRIAVASHDFPAAIEVATAIIERSRVDRIDRYDVLGSLLEVEVAAVAADPVDLSIVRRLLPRLAEHARPEAWRIAARIGYALGSPELLAWSADRAADLAGQAGPYAEQVRARVGAVLSSGR